jgi:hypothetical protein
MVLSSPFERVFLRVIAATDVVREPRRSSEERSSRLFVMWGASARESSSGRVMTGFLSGERLFRSRFIRVRAKERRR